MSSLAHGNFSSRRLVILGCGYVGTAVAELAVEHGASVAALTRNAETATALRTAGITTVVADLATDTWHSQVGHGADLVLNCVSSGAAGTEGYRHSYLAGMESVVRWASRSDGVGTIVYTSSTSVYPYGGGNVVTEEMLPVGHVPREGLNDVPSRPLDRPEILLAAERCLAESAVAERWFILRLAGIYGPGRHYLLEQVRANSVAGVGDHHLNLAHRDDIAAAIWACFDAPPEVRNAVFNVADDGPARKREVVEWLATRLQVPTPVFTGAPASERRSVTPDRIISNARLKGTLGWQPRFRTFREGYDAILADAI